MMTRIIFPSTCFPSTMVLTPHRRRPPRTVPFWLPSTVASINTEKLRTQLDQLREEAENTRKRANSARMRFMRLYEAAENLQNRAASSVRVGKEGYARDMLIQRKKLLQALEKSKNRIEVLDKLATKISEAISLKEAQLIENVAMAPEFSKEDTGDQIRFISPKDVSVEDMDVSVDDIHETSLSDSNCTTPGVRLELAVQPSDENLPAYRPLPNVEEIPNIGTKNDNKVLNKFKNLSSYKDFLKNVDEQLKEVEADLVGFLRFSTLILGSEQKHTNTKVSQTSELLEDICNIRERISRFIDNT